MNRRNCGNDDGRRKPFMFKVTLPQEYEQRASVKDPGRPADGAKIRKHRFQLHDPSKMPPSLENDVIDKRLRIEP